jgi:hypothetical protein
VTARLKPGRIHRSRQFAPTRQTSTEGPTACETFKSRCDLNARFSETGCEAKHRKAKDRRANASLPRKLRSELASNIWKAWQGVHLRTSAHMYAQALKISLGIINLDEDKTEMFGKVVSGCPRLRGPHEDPSNALQLRQQNSISKNLRLARTRRYRDPIGPRMEHKSSRGRDEFSCIRRLERPRHRNRSTHGFSMSTVPASAKRRE